MSLAENQPQPLLLDHYAVDRVLGSGAMGVVYLARDIRIGRLVALKTLQKVHAPGDDLSSRQHFERFRREAELCGSLLHPNIVTLYEVGYENRRFTYLAMEFVDGESLLSLIRRHERIDLRTAVRIADDVLQGLAFAHARGVIHRDVKPANILLTLDGQAKVTDFGVARSDASTDDLSFRGQLLGTPHYMAPEHVAGKTIDGRADVFSVGVVMYEMLAGRKPFDGVGLTDVLFNVVHQAPPPLSAAAPGVPSWCCAFIERLLEKDPERRPASAAAASAELRRLMTTNLPVIMAQSEAPPVVVGRELRADDTPTTPLSLPQPARRERSKLLRTVPLRIALPILAFQLAIAIAISLQIGRSIEDRPTVIFTPAEMADFKARESMMHEAKLLYGAGAYAASIQVYDRYLERYPWSTAARDGREHALAAQRRAEELQAAARTEAARGPVTTRGQTTASVASSDASTERASLWTRIRRFFRRGD
ncbi:MAG: serine/threonine-protein kinase [Thermoanaerobaculia bacterium]